MAAWQGLLHTHHHVMAVLDGELRAENDLTMTEYDVLLRLRRVAPSPLRMTQIAQRIMMSPSGLTRVVDGLEKAGLVRRSRIEEDARIVQVSLTEKGLHKLRAASQTHLRGIREHFTSRYTENQLKHIAQLLEIIAGQHKLH